MLKGAHLPEKEVLKRLLDELQGVATREAAFQVFSRAIADIGFNGAMFISRATGPGWVEEIAETTYPQAWVDHYIKSGYTRTDPTRRFATRQAKPFYWNEIFPLIRKKEMQVFHEAREHGLTTGIAVPIFEAGSLIGAIAVSSESERVCDPRLKATMGIAAQILCTIYNQILAEEKSTGADRLELPATLTKREAEVLRTVAMGFSNPEISDMLHISQSAVEYHLKNVFKKFDVQNRVSAVVTAIKLGLISP